MTIVLFEDERTTQLYPITVGRPAFRISCGSYQLLERVQTFGDAPRSLVRPHLKALLEADHIAVGLPPEPTSDWVVFINARLVPSATVIDQLRSLVASEQPSLFAQ